MNYTIYEQERIKDLSFYCVLDNIDEIDNFIEAERNMKYERNQYLSQYGGFELWKQKRNRTVETANI